MRMPRSRTRIGGLRHAARGPHPHVSNLLRRLRPERIDSEPDTARRLGRIQRERGEWDAALPSLERAIAGARAAASTTFWSKR